MCLLFTLKQTKIKKQKSWYIIFLLYLNFVIKMLFYNIVSAYIFFNTGILAWIHL